MNANNNKNIHTLADVIGAVSKFLPRLPQFLWSNLKLAMAKKSDIGSTGYYLQQAARRRPQQIFVEFEGRSYSYADFNAWVNQLAHALKSKGVGRGDCVALMFENRPELLACVFAVNKLGAIAGMINYKQKAEVLEHSFATIQPRLLIVGEECIDTLVTAKHLPETMQRFYMPERGSQYSTPEYPNLQQISEQQSKENLAETDTITLSEQSFFVFTSGTTGLPKAAPMTHLRWVKAGIGFGRMALGLKSTDKLYSCSPLYHNTALSIALSAVVLTRSTLVLARKFSASHFWQEIHESDSTAFVYIGEICRYLLNQPASQFDRQHKVRAVLGNGLRAEIWDAFQQRFQIEHICELYGASEGNIGFVNAFNLKRTVGFSPMTFAIVQFDVEHEQPIVDQQGALQRVKTGDVGLLLAEVSDKTPFDGYANNHAANEAKLLRNVFKQGDCWFNTGDIVCDQGYRHIAFIDRVGDTFRWKSENVATTEVEAQLQTFSDIVEAVVYGVQIPHTDGRAGMASLVVAQAQRFNPVEFYQHIQRKLPDYAVPLFVRLREFHEVTGTFKIKKTELKQQGFRPSTGNEQVYVLLDREKGYQRLSADLYQAIEQGRIRF